MQKSGSIHSSINVIRAIGAVYIRRALRPLISIGALVIGALLLLGGWLTMQSAWWWILEAALIALSIGFVVVISIIFFVIRRIAPELTKQQRSDINAFVDKLERVTEHVQTPYPMIIFYVIRDIIWPRKDSFVQTVAHDSKTLAPELNTLRQLF